MWNNTSTDMLNLMSLLDVPSLSITDIITILSPVFTVIGIIICIICAKKYSSVYHVKENNRAKEKYLVSEKVE